MESDVREADLEIGANRSNPPNPSQGEKSPDLPTLWSPDMVTFAIPPPAEPETCGGVPEGSAVCHVAAAIHVAG